MKAAAHQSTHSVQIGGKGVYCFNCRTWIEKRSTSEALIDHLERGNHIHFAQSPNARRRCGAPAKQALVASNYWPAVSCPDCRERRGS